MLYLDFKLRIEELKIASSIKRDVFYLAGYDPRSYRYYYALLNKNLYLQNKINALNLTLSPIQTNPQNLKYCTITHENALTQYYFCSWNAIIKQYWANSIRAYLKDFCIFVKLAVSSGLFWNCFSKSRTQLIAGFYPIVFFTLSYALCFFILNFLITLEWNPYLTLLLCVAIFVGMSWGIFTLGKKYAAFWLSNIYAFCAKYTSKNRIKGLEAWLETYSQIIFEQIRQNTSNPCYELIICSHSVGTILSVNLAARVLQKLQNQNLPCNTLKMLTLGHCIPLVSFQKSADFFRNDLASLHKAQIVWIDFTSPIDGACFPLVDFMSIAGLAQNPYPKYLSTRFHKLYTQKSYKEIRYDWYKAHFLYLYANEILGVYDFYNLIGGPKFLEEKITTQNPTQNFGGL